MATPAATPPVGALIADYLRDAEAGRVRDPAGGTYTPASLRSLSRSFALVEAAAPQLDAGGLAGVADSELEQIGRHVLEQAGLPQSRLGSIVHALRILSAYAGGRAVAQRASPPYLVAAPEARTPTYTMLALGSHVSAWIERILVIAFVLTAIGLLLALV
jgi:hypothetical protein